MRVSKFACVGWVMLLIGAGCACAAEFLPVDLSLTNNVSPAPPARRAFLLDYSDNTRPSKYLEWLWKDPVNLLTRPAYWRGVEWRTVGIDTLIVGALFPLDNSVRDFVRDNHSPSAIRTLKVFDDWYGNYYLALYGAGLFVSGFAFHNEKLSDSGFLAVESVAYAAVIDVVLKDLTNRERPRTGASPYTFEGPFGKTHGSSSFVSGDTIVAFAFASSVSEVWQNPWVTWPLYGLAVGVGAQRIEVNAHWASDVVGAALLGHAIGKTIVRFHYGRNVEGHLEPCLARDSAGVKLTVQF